MTKKRVAREHASLREAARDDRARTREREDLVEEARQPCARGGEIGGMLDREIARPIRDCTIARIGIDVPPRATTRRRSERRLREEKPCRNAERVRERR